MARNEKSHMQLQKFSKAVKFTSTEKDVEMNTLKVECEKLANDNANLEITQTLPEKHIIMLNTKLDGLNNKPAIHWEAKNPNIKSSVEHTESQKKLKCRLDSEQDERFTIAKFENVKAKLRQCEKDKDNISERLHVALQNEKNLVAKNADLNDEARQLGLYMQKVLELEMQDVTLHQTNEALKSKLNVEEAEHAVHLEQRASAQDQWAKLEICYSDEMHKWKALEARLRSDIASLLDQLSCVKTADFFLELKRNKQQRIIVQLGEKVAGFEKRISGFLTNTKTCCKYMRELFPDIENTIEKNCDCKDIPKPHLENSNCGGKPGRDANMISDLARPKLSHNVMFSTRSLRGTKFLNCFIVISVLRPVMEPPLMKHSTP